MFSEIFYTSKTEQNLVKKYKNCIPFLYQTPKCKENTFQQYINIYYQPAATVYINRQPAATQFVSHTSKNDKVQTKKCQIVYFFQNL